MPVTPSHKILNYFNTFLESNKLSFLRDTALEQIKETYSDFIDSVDIEKGIIKYWKIVSDQHNNGEPKEGLVTYDFYKDHKLKLSNNAIAVIKLIDGTVYSKTESNEPYKPLLQNINQELHYLNLRADKLYPNYKELFKALKHIENHLLVRYEVKPYATKRADDKLSYFGFKDTISVNKFRDLYDLLERLDIIEYDVVNDDTFIEVLLENPTNSDSVIKFNCSNSLVVTLLNKLRPYFSSLTPKKIELSQRFYTKQGLVLKESNYRTTNSRLKNPPSKKTASLIGQIDAILNS